MTETKQRIASARLKISDKQFEKLDRDTRREMIRQLMFIDTTNYEYCIGAHGHLWTMVRYKTEPEYGYRFGQRMQTGRRLVISGSGEIVDTWA